MRLTIEWAAGELTRILEAKPEDAQDWHALVNDLGAIRARLELALLQEQ
ncbi:MAG: hypothetical protein AAFY26_20480 [Cyanobacteria bacterium J06638_22]